MRGEFDQNHSNELRDATRSCDVHRDFHHLTLIWTNVNVKSSTSVLGRACFHWQASLPWWFLLAHLASSRPSLCSAAHILNVGWPIETARCVRGGAMAINQRRVILRQSGGMQFLSVKANLEEVKKKKAGNPEGRIFVETVEMTSITRDLEHITCFASGRWTCFTRGLVSNMLPGYRSPSDPKVSATFTLVMETIVIKTRSDAWKKKYQTLSGVSG